MKRFIIFGSVAFLLPVVVLAQSSRVVVDAEVGYSIEWNGNNGNHFNPETGAEAPENDGWEAAYAFASSNYFPNGIHDAVNVVDGYYGNSSSWIATPADADPWLALGWEEELPISRIAWSRDNGDSEGDGQLKDRVVGVYTLQFTRTADPDEETEETDDPGTGWVTFGTVEYLAGDENLSFTSYLHHQFEVMEGDAPIAATGLRIKVSNSGICIDEVEVNGPPAASQKDFLDIQSAAGIVVSWTQTNGDWFTEESPAPAQENLALSSNGSLAFGSSELGLGIHLVSAINDGFYSNAKSWIAAAGDQDPFIGVSFGQSRGIKSIAWGRDNGDDTGDCCGGQLKDRWKGVYTLQTTQVDEPGLGTEETGDVSTGWSTMATIEFKGETEDFIPYLRHEFSISNENGSPVGATAVRLKVSDVLIAIDELEVNTLPKIPEGAIEIYGEEGFSVTWNGNQGDNFDASAQASAPQNAALATMGTTPFGSSELGLGIHLVKHVNDGLYGNSNSWISSLGLGAAPGEEEEFIGLNFGKAIPVSAIAWGRDNGNTETDACGGTCKDRSLGIYTLQYTQLDNPGADTEDTEEADSGWQTIATIQYLANAPEDFVPYLRHHFEIAQGGDGAPIVATGIRIKVSDGMIAIDELEIYPTGEEREPGDPNVKPTKEEATMAIEPESGFEILWDGNEGDFYDDAALAEAPENAALESKGATVFGSSELDLGVHYIRNINDGLYGNGNSWIPKFTVPADDAPFVGISFGGLIPVRSIAWGRDNGNNTDDCCGGQLRDRAIDVYQIDYTTIEDPSSDTPDADNPGEGWVKIGTVEYIKEGDDFYPWLRHQFDVSLKGNPIMATGIRIRVNRNSTAIDEVEVNPLMPVPEGAIDIYEEEDFSVTWNGNQGDFFDVSSNAKATRNAALASEGTLAFGSSELDLGIHLIEHVNDGLYGNSNSWISALGLGGGGEDYEFVGLNFGKVVPISSLAWGRDNGNTETDACGGTCKDRSIGIYTIQYTLVHDPDEWTEETDDAESGWQTLASVEILAGAPKEFIPYLRHEFKIGTGEEMTPLEATGIRIIVSSGMIAIDEIEVNAGEPPIEESQLAIGVENGDLVISWTGDGILESSDSIDPNAQWSTVPDQANPYRVPAGAAISGSRFYRTKSE